MLLQTWTTAPVSWNLQGMLKADVKLFRTMWLTSSIAMNVDIPGTNEIPRQKLGYHPFNDLHNVNDIYRPAAARGCSSSGEPNGTTLSVGPSHRFSGMEVSQHHWFVHVQFNQIFIFPCKRWVSLEICSKFPTAEGLGMSSRVVRRMLCAVHM